MFDSSISIPNNVWWNFWVLKIETNILVFAKAWRKMTSIQKWQKPCSPFNRKCCPGKIFVENQTSKNEKNIFSNNIFWYITHTQRECHKDIFVKPTNILSIDKGNQCMAHTCNLQYRENIRSHWQVTSIKVDAVLYEE